MAYVWVGCHPKHSTKFRYNYDNHQVSYKPIILMAFDRYLSPDSDDHDGKLTPKIKQQKTVKTNAS